MQDIKLTDDQINLIIRGLAKESTIYAHTLSLRKVLREERIKAMEMLRQIDNICAALGQPKMNQFRYQ